jgi:hypothetical protein
MLTLFRRIRKGLLGEGGGFKYLLYALGEILLVMVGILLALQVNNWNEDRLRQKDEMNILTSLKTGLEQDAMDIRLNIQFHKRVISSSKIILDHMGSDMPYHDSLAVHFFNTAIFTVFIHTTSAFQSLKSFGVNLISNVELRDKIINIYDGQYRYIQENESVNIQRMEDALNDFLSYRFVESHYLDSVNMDFNGKMVPLNYADLKKDERYRYFLRSTVNRNKIYLDYVLSAPLQAVEETIEGIEAELARFKQKK